ncbi:pre-peptidase C-terminal domain-containing protein [Brevundimonas sp. FT23028]|uniref:pre-peptidase C-terminal domain-containing protein n=1 Tax=Brevundimonas sp. FT23028 TaxID=3393748 RepID=UPI003B585E86
MLRTILVATTALTVLTTPASAQQRPRDTPPVSSPRQPTAPAILPGRSDQPSAAIRPGQTVRGRLERGDNTLDSGEFVDRYVFQARRGEVFEAALSGTGLDPYLLVRGAGGLSEDNDDDAGSRDSRLRFTVAADGEVTLGATTYQTGETGSYALTLREIGGRGAAREGDPRRDERSASRESIRIGQTVSGALAPGDATLNSGEFVDSWTFDGRRGQRLDIQLGSTAFDPYVAITGPGGFSEFNDDDATRSGSRDSRLQVTLPADGEYVISATSYEPGERGAYRLSVADGEGAGKPPTPPVHPSEQASPGGEIRIGQTIGGALSPGDETLDSGEYFDRYTFTGRRGERVAVELTSAAFDAYTIVRTPSGEQFDNDDGEDGTDSRQQLILPEDGEYVVQVTSYRPGETGSYRFTVEPGRESARQASAPGGRRIFAVMVGVSDYGGTQNDLPFTDEDARKLAEALDEGGALNESSVVLTNAQATVGGVRDAFRRVAAEAGPDDLFLFFFSGHGNQTETPVSGVEPDGRSETLVLRDGEISDTELGDLFGRLNTRLSLLVIDACFSGGFARNVVDRPGVMGLFSSEEDLTSAVASKFRAGGYLSHFLREGMVGGADLDGDRLVTAGELSTWLRRQFRVEVEDVESETQDGQRNYQNLVIDRGGVQVDDVIVRLPAS